MKPDPESAEAESVLKSALQPNQPLDHASDDERQARLRSSFRLQTAAHDIGHFVCSNLFSALGKLLLGLWRLAASSAELPRKKTDLTSENDDKPH